MKELNYKKINKSIILYDSRCVLCNEYIHFVIKNDKNNRLCFTSIYSIIGKQIIKDYEIDFSLNNTIILYQDHIIKKKSDAILEIIKKLRFPINTIYIFYIIPKFIRNYIYNSIAKNRYQIFGKYNRCKIPNKEYIKKFLN